MKRISLIISIVLFTICNINAQEAKLVLPIGHTDWVSSAQFSPDGKWIVTASNDGTAKIWDAQTGKFLQDLKGHAGSVRSAQFSPDGKRIVTASWDSTAKIWDAQNGKLLQDLKGHTGSVKSAQFSSDGKWVVSASNDCSAILWEASTGNILHDLKGHSSHVSSAQFSSDGKLIVTASEDQTAKIWESSTGKLLYDLHGHESSVIDARFSQDGKRIISSSFYNTRIWDASTGTLINNINGILVGGSIQVSPDGKWFVVAASSTTKYDLSSGRLLLEFKGKTIDMEEACFTFDGKGVIQYSFMLSKPKIWNIISGEPILDLNNVSWFRSAQLSDGKMIAIVKFGQPTMILELPSKKRLYNLQIHSDVQFSPDGKWIVSISEDDSLKIWEAETGRLLHNLLAHEADISSVQFSPNGKWILTASYDKTAKVWDVNTGKLIHILSGHTNYLSSAQFSLDNSRIITTSMNRYHQIMTDKLFANFDSTKTLIDNNEINKIKKHSGIKIWNSFSGECLFDLLGHTDYVNSAQFSPDGKWIVTASYDNTSKIWDALTGKHRFDLKHNGVVESAQFSSNSKWIITASRDHNTKIWETKSGKKLHTLTGHTNSVRSARFSTNGKYIITTGDDNKTIIWEAETGKLLYTRLQLTNGDWLVYDEHYRYDGSEGARDYLYFVCGLEVIGLDQLKDQLYVPGLVEKIMNGQEINYPKLSDLDICGALPLVERINEDSENYHYQITERKLAIDRVEVYVNDKMVSTYPISDLQKKDSLYFLEISSDNIKKHFIPGEENQVNVIAIAKQKGEEMKSRGAAVLQYEEAEEEVNPKLYAVMVGIDDYKDDMLDLNFPAKDASDLARTVEVSAKELLGEENVFIYKVHSNAYKDGGYTTPEKEGIRKALEDIGKKAEPQDVIMIFFAGHGIMQGEEEKTFTFLTAEASNYNPIGISTKELQNWLSYEGPHKMLANKTILIFDACHSGQFTEEMLALARNDEETERIRQVEDLKDKSGTFILAASAPNQSAFELPQYQQGLLTYSLLYSLKNNPEVLDEDKYLNVQKWFLESEEYLQELVESMGYQQDAQPFGSANIRIGVVNEKVRNSIQLAEEKPLIVCGNVGNKATFNDNLQLKEKIVKELYNASERGVKSRFIYSPKKSPDAFVINIIYELDGVNMNCELSFWQNDILLSQVTVEGKKNELDQLLDKIILKIEAFLRNT